MVRNRRCDAPEQRFCDESENEGDNNEKFGEAMFARPRHGRRMGGERVEKQDGAGGVENSGTNRRTGNSRETVAILRNCRPTENHYHSSPSVTVTVTVVECLRSVTNIFRISFLSQVAIKCPVSERNYNSLLVAK